MSIPPALSRRRYPLTLPPRAKTQELVLLTPYYNRSYNYSMARVSKKRLDADVEKRMFDLFWRSLSRIGGPEDVSEFFADLLGKNEQLMLAKRYTIAVLLAKGKNYHEIANTINVSPSTINSVANWLKNLKPATKKIIDRHLKDESWGQFFDKIEATVDLIPPIVTPYAQKPKAGKEKFQRLLARSARSVLR